MKKASIFAAFAATACLASAQMLQSVPAPTFTYEAEASESSMEFGYCGEMATYIGWSNAAEATLRGTIQIPTETALRFEGAKVSKVLVALGNTNFFDSSIYISQGLEDEENVYDQEAEFMPGTWNEIALDEPYTIDGTEFFIGFSERVTNTA